MTEQRAKLIYKGGPGSGHHGHSGRPGKVGGSSGGGSGGGSGGAISVAGRGNRDVMRSTRNRLEEDLGGSNNFSLRTSTNGGTMLRYNVRNTTPQKVGQLLQQYGYSNSSGNVYTLGGVSAKIGRPGQFSGTFRLDLSMEEDEY